jgi:hypothetical protein
LKDKNINVKIQNEVNKLIENKRKNRDIDIVMKLEETKKSIVKYEKLSVEKDKEIIAVKCKLKEQKNNINDYIKPDLIKFRKKYEKLKTECYNL